MTDEDWLSKVASFSVVQKYIFGQLSNLQKTYIIDVQINLQKIFFFLVDNLGICNAL